MKRDTSTSVASARLGVLGRHLTAGGAPRMLDGIKVVELATVVAAPAACALLCDHGAEVVKIENPRNPDIARVWGRGDAPSDTADPGLRSAPGGGGSAFVQLNRGKRSLALDPTTSAGNALLKKLIAKADIFITNVRQKSLVKMGLDYETLGQTHPKLIYGHLSAYGRAGPAQNDPGYDFGAFWAYSGVQEIIRSSDTAPPPRFPGAIGDNITASQMFGGILGALYHRERTGQGQLVDAALLRAGIWSLAHPMMQLAGGNKWAEVPDGSPETIGVRETTEIGKRRTSITNAPFRCGDGVFVQLMGLETRRHMPGFLKAIGLTQEQVFGRDPFAKSTAPMDWAAATRVVDKRMATKTFPEWAAIFATHDVWFKRVNRFGDMLEDEQARAAGSFVDVPASISRHRLVGTPVLLSKSGAEPRAGAPKHGEHTASVLAELGCDAADVARLVRDGVVKVSGGGK